MKWNLRLIVLFVMISCDKETKKEIETQVKESSPTRPVVLNDFTEGNALPAPALEPQVIVINRTPKAEKLDSSATNTKTQTETSTNPSPAPKLPPEPPKGDPPPVVENIPMDLQTQVTNIFSKHCISCHSATNVQGNFGNLDNLDALILAGRYIVPEKPDQSLIYTKLAPVGNMPPSGALKPDEVETVKKWILQLKPTANKPLSFAEALGLMRADLQTIAPADQSQIRYFTLDVVNNAQVSPETLTIQRLAFAKTLNSLSSAVAVQTLSPIDKDKLIYRVRLGDFGIGTTVFEGVINSFYPFGFQLTERPVDHITQEMILNDRILRDLTGSQTYMIRIDWVVATATLPIPYEILLQQGENHGALDAKLGVDRSRAVTENRVMRSGFKQSGVSSQNRIMERMEQSNGRSYWQSYDFASLEQNIFELPLGPVGTHPTRNFDHDGGEVIYQLPNGLFAYRLVDKVGVVIDKGPTSIVKQNDAPPQFLAAIVNGVSCMNCHGAGILPKRDEILTFVNQNRADFLGDEIQKITRLYPESRFLDAAVSRDNALYFDALKRIGVDPLKPDPVNQAYRHYNRSLSKIDIAAELATTQKVVENLLTTEPFKTKWQGVLANGVIAREEFNRLLPQAWAAVHQGAIDLRFPEAGDFLVTASCMFANQLQMDGCLIDNRPPPPPPAPTPPAPAPASLNLRGTGAGN